MTAACPSFAFEIVLQLADGVAADDAWRDAFLATVENRGLSASGGGTRTMRYLVTRDGGQAVDADREAVRVWADSSPAIASVRVGPLIDLHERP